MRHKSKIKCNVFVYFLIMTFAYGMCPYLISAPVEYDSPVKLSNLENSCRRLFLLRFFQGRDYLGSKSEKWTPEHAIQLWQELNLIFSPLDGQLGTLVFENGAIWVISRDSTIDGALLDFKRQLKLEGLANIRAVQIGGFSTKDPYRLVDLAANSIEYALKFDFGGGCIGHSIDYETNTITFNWEKSKRDQIPRDLPASIGKYRILIE